MQSGPIHVVKPRRHLFLCWNFIHYQVNITLFSDSHNQDFFFDAIHSCSGGEALVIDNEEHFYRLYQYWLSVYKFFSKKINQVALYTPMTLSSNWNSSENPYLETVHSYFSYIYNHKQKLHPEMYEPEHLEFSFVGRA